MFSERVLRTRIKPTLYQKSFELVIGTESRVLNIQAANKQFSFFTISFVFDRSDQQVSMIESVQLENASNTCSSFNTVKFDTSNADDKCLLYMQFVIWYFKGSSIVFFSDYANNLIFPELPDLKNYFTNSDEKVFIDLKSGNGCTGELEKVNRDDIDLSITVTLKAVTTKKMRLRVTEHYQGENLYS